jgi:hypothetical protein
METALNQNDVSREALAFQEKISLAKLEASKAEGRVAELEYQRDRYMLDIYCMQLKEAIKVPNDAK